MDQIGEMFTWSPDKSTWRASTQIGIPKTKVWRVLHKRLEFKPYKLQLLKSFT